MPQLSRRAILVGSGASLLGTSFGGCLPQQPVGANVGPVGPLEESVFRYPPRTSGTNPAFLRTRVAYAGSEKPGTIVIDPGARYLYFVEEGGHAIRYGVGVGKEGFAWSGTATIHDKQEWPDWYPPKEMIQRRPDIRCSTQRAAKWPRRPWWAVQSARGARHVPLARQQGHALSNPWHQRALDHRHERVVRLHQVDQSGCH